MDEYDCVRQVSITPYELARAIGRLVVDNNDLVYFVFLFQQSVEAEAEIFNLLQHWDDHRKFGHELSSRSFGYPEMNERARPYRGIERRSQPLNVKDLAYRELASILRIVGLCHPSATDKAISDFGEPVKLTDRRGKTRRSDRWWIGARWWWS